MGWSATAREKRGSIDPCPTDSRNSFISPASNARPMATLSMSRPSSMLRMTPTLGFARLADISANGPF